MESTATAETKTPEAEITVTTSQPHQPIKSLSFTNGQLKRHHHHHQTSVHDVDVSYKECLKNHAASLGGHALDGCGEFMPSPSATPTDPTSLKCAACGCHRNFHRREPEESARIIDYHHQPPPPPPPLRGPHSPNSPSPPPLSSSYYPSAPHMLLALRTGLVGPPDHHPPAVMEANPNGRKRFRTKFSQEQKEGMHSFSERLGWKIQKGDEHLVEDFCNEIGIRKDVLKVWMHNNKHTVGKNSKSSLDIHSNNGNNNHNHDENFVHVATTNGSSSSS